MKKKALLLILISMFISAIAYADCFDTDSDGICDDVDNCLTISNSGQENADNNALGDACDVDTVYGTISGDIQAGVTVNIYRTSCGSDVLIVTTSTDQNGYYSFGNLESGKLLVVAYASGYSFTSVRSWPQLPQTEIQSYDFTTEAETPEPAFTTTVLYSTTMPQNTDEIDIYYPVPDENDSASYEFPVALFLQGGRVNKSYFSEFAEGLAKYGFIVVVPNHDADFTLTDPDYPGIEIDFVGFFPENQQIPDVLAFMNYEHADTDSPLYGIVDTETLVLTGHSFGSAVILDAIQETCEFPLCRPEGSTFTLPEEVKAVALTGINTIPFGNPFDTVNRPTDNPVPMVIINGDLDENAEFHDTKDSYKLIENLPKSLVFVKGANHYGLCTENNPGNPDYPGEPQNDGTPTPQENTPTLDQNISIETNARWAALFLRAHALNDTAAMEYISTTGRLLDPNVEVRYGDEQLDYEVLLSQASEIDENICEYAQTLIGDIDENSGVTVDAVSPGSAFTSTKATVDNGTDTAIPVYMIVQGTSDEIFRNDKINTMIWCKTRIPEAIKWNTGINYTEQNTAAGTCKQVNEYIYDMTLDLLTDEQREKYNNEGKPIVFTDETIVGQGIDFYALDQYSLISDMGTHLSISPASLESDFDIPDDDRHGAKYCKIISSQNLLAWMQDGAFKNGDSLTPADSLTEITCDDLNNSTGSCFFVNEHSSTYMCEDYIGPNYTGGESGTAKAKCDLRDGDINDEYEIHVEGIYVDGVACADRTDTDIAGPITGACAINESVDGAYTWSLYYPEGEADCPLRFFNCNTQ
jgi:hypothetical protein